MRTAPGAEAVNGEDRKATAPDRDDNWLEEAQVTMSRITKLLCCTIH